MVEKGKRGYAGALTDCVHDVRKQNTIAQVLLEVIDSSLVVRSRQVLVRPVRVNLEKIPVQQKRNKNKRGRLIGSNELSNSTKLLFDSSWRATKSRDNLESFRITFNSFLIEIKSQEKCAKFNLPELLNVNTSLQCRKRWRRIIMTSKQKSTNSVYFVPTWIFQWLNNLIFKCGSLVRSQLFAFDNKLVTGHNRKELWFLIVFRKDRNTMDRLSTASVCDIKTSWRHKRVNSCNQTNTKFTSR